MASLIRFALLVFLGLIGIACVTTDILELAAYNNYRYFEPGIYAGLSTGSTGIPLGQTNEVWAIRELGGIRVRGLDQTRTAARAGLESGDQILTVNGVDLSRKPEAYFAPFSRGRAGDRVTIGFDRKGERRECTITLEQIPPPHWGLSIAGTEMDFGISTIWVIDGPRVFACALFLFLGILVGVVGARRPMAFEMSIAAIGISLSMIQAFPFIRSMPSAAVAAKSAVRALSFGFAGPLLLRVFSLFPVPTRLGRGFLRLQWLVFGLFGLLAVFALMREMRIFLGGAIAALAGNPVVRLLGRIGEDPATLVLCALLLVLIIAQRIESRNNPQNRLRIVEVGSLAAALGGVIIEIWFLWFARHRLPTAWRPVGLAVGYYLPWVLISCFPICLGYAILARRVPGLQFIVRRGIQHLLLSRATLVVEGFIVFLVVWGVLRQSVAHGAASGGVASGAAVIGTLVVVGAMGKLNRRLMPLIDRRFFRERCDVGRILLDLSQRLSKLHQRDPILRHSAATVMRALHPSRVSVLVKDLASGEFHCDAHLGDGAGHSVTAESLEEQANPQTALGLLPGDAIVQSIERGAAWLEIDPEDLTYETEAESRLLHLGCELLVSIEGSEGLTGVMALGPKRSEEPYASEDRNLLVTVCRQIGLALENADLLEVAKREAQHGRDLEIAHTVQQNLFPKQFPVRHGWDFAGICRPAKATGGDYYDLLDLPTGKIAFALGDVSGKGLGASLLTASVHAVVRSQFRAEVADLAQLMVEVNEHLLSSTSPEMFVTLFVGILDPGSGALRFVNGGHPPPMLISTVREIQPQLEMGGMIVGIIPGAEFREGHVNLGPGEFLVLYSDGVTEAMNQTQEMFDEDRLREVLLSARDLGASAILNLVVDSVDRFAKGCEQADDIAVVVIQRRA